MKPRTRLKKLLAVVASGTLVGLMAVSSASAAEIATPRTFKTQVFFTPGPWGQPIAKKLVGETYLGNQLRLLVLEDRVFGGVRWLKVRLPRRPNDSSVWLREDQVRITQTDMRIVIDVSSRTLTLFRGPQVVKRVRVIVGAPDTPTPIGQFAIYERYRPGRTSDLRPWVLELTAHSTKLKTFQGGPGRVAIHGRHGALAQAAWGSAASNGCIRTPNGPLNRIARQVPVGAPVLVKR